MDFIETSAKTSANVDDAFKKTTQIIYQKIKNKEIDLLNDVVILTNGRVAGSNWAVSSNRTTLKRTK